MHSEVVVFYCFGPRDGDGVNVLSYSNNINSAKQAMLNMFGRKESDIKHTSGEKEGAPTFDGRNSHL